MRELTGHIRNKKAFTLIELLVVIAVLAILVLLATPRFLGHTETAKIRRIQHDVKVVEGMVAEHLINYGNIDDWDGPIFNLETETLYNTEGPVNEDNLYEPDTYYVVSDKVLNNSRSKLKGSFYANNGGSVYYSETELTGGPLSEDEIDDLVENLNYIPVANATELAQINGSGYDEGEVVYEELTWGAGTPWETKTTGKLDSSYIQVQDIDLAHIDEWAPIGVSRSYPFSGDYNGGKYVISNLKMTEDNSSTNSALFGTVNVNKDIMIKNINLNNANIVVKDGYSGLLIGLIEGDGSSNLIVETININNSYVTNSNGYAGTVGLNAGGLSRVSNVNVNAEIRASEVAAGLLSYNVSTSEPLNIENIIINGVVEGLKEGYNYSAGGIIGLNTGSIERIENISIGADVISRGPAGGVIARNYSNQADNLVINNVNVNGNITSLSNEYASAIIGANSSGSSSIKEIKNITINSNIKSEGPAAGLIAGNFTTKPLDVDNVTFNGSVVAGEDAGGLIGKSTTTLGNVSNIEIIADVTSKHNVAGGVFGTTLTSTGNIENVYFEGNIIAKNSAGGLIAHNTAKLGNITNIEIISDIRSNSSDAGGLIGGSFSGDGNGDIDNISFIGDISAEKGVGGLIGRNTSVLESISNVDIKSKMISRNENTEYRDSKAGGLMGESHSYSSELSNWYMSMSNINIEGEIIGNNYVGGLIGQLTNPTSYDNINIEAKIVAERSDTTENFIGGLAGFNTGSEPITMSHINIQGEISGGYSTGGLFGFNVSTIDQVDRLSMDVKLSNGHYVGSLIAQDRTLESSTILNSHISGEIISSDTDGSVGGLYGVMSSDVNKKLTIKDTTVSVTQKDPSKYAGGIVGKLTDKLFLDFDNLEIVSLLKGDKSGQFIGLYSDDELDSTFFDFSGATFSGSGATSEIGEEIKLD